MGTERMSQEWATKNIIDCVEVRRGQLKATSVV